MTVIDSRVFLLPALTEMSNTRQIVALALRVSRRIKRGVRGRGAFRCVLMSHLPRVGLTGQKVQAIVKPISAVPKLDSQNRPSTHNDLSRHLPSTSHTWPKLSKK
jgi:hypothetical protein